MPRILPIHYAYDTCKHLTKGAITMTKLYSFSDLLEIFPFGKTKIRQLIDAGVLPVVKVGRQYVTSDEAIQRWVLENIGKEILF